MKICKYCGTEYADTQLKCPGCGANKVLTEAEIAEENMLQEREGSGSDFGPNPGFEDENGKLKKVLIVCGVVLAVIVLIVIISLSSNDSGSTKVSNDEYKASYEAGVSYLSQGEYEEAISKLAFVSSDSKYYDEAQIPLEEAKEKYREDILKKVDSYLENDAYDIALGMLTEALKVLPNDDVLSSKYKDIENQYKEKVKEDSINSANNSAANEDYASAIDTINKAILEIGNDEELLSLLNSYKKLFREKLFVEAEETYRSLGYEEAINILNDGLSSLEDDQEIVDKIEYYKQFKPVLLGDIDHFSQTSSGYREIVSSVKDNLGNTQRNVLVATSGEYYTRLYCSTTYKLNSKYSKISGTLFLSHYSRSDDDVCPTIKIICDGSTVAEYSVSKGKEPIAFETDLTGVQELTVILSDTGSYGGYEWICGGVSDLYLYK